MSNTVALAKCDDYIFDQVFSKIKELLELVPPPDVNGKVVLIKPNILYPKKPELAVCTHPVVVGAVVKAFVERVYGEGSYDSTLESYGKPYLAQTALQDKVGEFLVNNATVK